MVLSYFSIPSSSAPLNKEPLDSRGVVASLIYVYREKNNEIEMIYNTNDNKQNYHFCGIKVVNEISAC